MNFVTRLESGIKVCHVLQTHIETRATLPVQLGDNFIRFRSDFIILTSGYSTDYQEL